MYSKETLKFYQENSDYLFDHYNSKNIVKTIKVFEKLIKKGYSILDIGCGSGRDVMYFFKEGYKVIGFDATRELIDKAREHYNDKEGSFFKNMRIEDMEYKNEFNAIWASAVLLHFTNEELQKIIPKCHKALKDDGYMYASFKYGLIQPEEFTGRYFNYFTHFKVSKLFEENGFKIIKLWDEIEFSKKSETRWLNIIVKKV